MKYCQLVYNNLVYYIANKTIVEDNKRVLRQNNFLLPAFEINPNKLSYCNIVSSIDL